jgi:hypothetical protein
MSAGHRGGKTGMLRTATAWARIAAIVIVEVIAIMIVIVAAETIAATRDKPEGQCRRLLC